jgi:hypothetical protein
MQDNDSAPSSPSGPAKGNRKISGPTPMGPKFPTPTGGETPLLGNALEATMIPTNGPAVISIQTDKDEKSGGVKSVLTSLVTSVQGLIM